MIGSNFSTRNNRSDNSIALWGPTGAGKDWLFRSFVKELEYYNHEDPGFHYELGMRLPGFRLPTPMEVKPPVHMPTVGIEEYNYVFKREALTKDFAHLTSSQEHDIIIHNDKGANLVDSLDGSVAFESTFTALIQARHLLLVLGIPKEEMTGYTSSQATLEPQSGMDTFGPVMDTRADTSSGLHSREATRGDWSRAEYLKFLRLLLTALGKTPRRNLAVCMTKSDMLNLRGDSIKMVERRYGSEMIRLLELYAQQHNIKVFATSAAGYLRLEDHALPNINGENGRLRDEDKWDPLNTAAPFFWIFELIERERMQKGFALTRGDRIKAYIPYPDPRPF